MDAIIRWIEIHFQELLMFLGAGGGGGFLGKKLTDRQQDKKLKELADSVALNKSEIIMIKLELETNTKFDQQLRDEIKEGKAETHAILREIRESINAINQYLLNSK